MADCALERTAAGIINAFCGCAGQRCMALPVVVAEEPVADALVRLLREKAAHLKLGPAYDKNTTLGPLVSASAERTSLTGSVEVSGKVPNWSSTGAASPFRDMKTASSSVRRCLITSRPA